MNTTTTTTNTRSETSVVPNIWELRKEAEEKRKRLEQELKDLEMIQKKLAEQERVRQTEEAKKLAKPQGNKGPNRHKKQKKLQAQKAKAEEAKAEPEQEPEQQAEPEEEQVNDTEFVQVSKKVYVPKQESSKTRVAKAKALNKAYQQMIAYCVNSVPSYKIEKINEGIEYIADYKFTSFIDISDDELVMEEDGETFTFSKAQFLESKAFQYKVREKLFEKTPEAWISLFPGRKEGTYCIRFSKKQ
jgi:DNA polymerase III gamma/tau subunit